MKDNNSNNKSSIVILTIIGIATLLVAVIGATFAYFTVNITGNPTEKNMEVQSVQLGEIVFAHGNDLLYENAIPGRPAHDGTNDIDNMIDFTITNDDSATITQKYVVMLHVTSNTYITDNVVFTLTETGVGTSKTPPAEYADIAQVNSIRGGQLFTETTEGNSQNYVLHRFEGDETDTKLGFVPASFTGEMQIGIGTLGNFGAQDAWNFELWINETGEDQADDQGKRIEAYITVETADIQSNEKGIINDN